MIDLETDESGFYWKYEQALIVKSVLSSKELARSIEEIYPQIQKPLEEIIGGPEAYHVKVALGKKEFYVRIGPKGQVSIPLKDPYYGHTPIKTLEGKKILQFNPWPDND